MAIPKLRFKEFILEYLSCTIGDTLSIKHGKDYKHLTSNKKLYPVYGTGGIITYVDEFLCDWNCVCIGRKGTIDIPRYMDRPFWSVDTLFYSKPKENNLPKYQYYLFQRINWKQFNEASGVPSLSATTIENIKINIPSCNEQKKIADFLSLLDRKIALQEKKIALLKDYKKGVLHLIFSKNSDFQYKEIGEFAEVYQPKTISLDDCKYGGDYSVYGANGLIGYYRDYNHELEQVTISCRGENSGTVNFIPPFSWITGNSMVINLDQATNILKKFVCYSLQYENLKSIVSGSGQPQIIRKDVLNFKIKVTNIKKQQEIIECLEKIELKIINQRNKEVALKAIKNSLLQQMFI